MDEKPKKIDPAYPLSGSALGVGHDAALGTLGAASNLVVPMSGPLVQALIRRCVQAPLEVRRTAWFNLVGEGLRELQDRLGGFDPNSLAENEEFVSAVAQATRAAVATHYAEKLEALRNVVLNAAAGMTLDEVTRGTFMALLERFSTLHLRLVHVLADPISAPEIQAIGGSQLMMNLSYALGLAFEGRVERNVLDIAIADLQTALLLREIRTAAITPDPLTSRCLTPLGDAFLRFVTSPAVLKKA